MGEATQRRERRTRDRLLATLQEDLARVATSELVEKLNGDLTALPQEKLLALYERSPGRFVRDWNRLLSGWLAEIGQRAHAVREIDASEDGGGKGRSVAIEALPDAPSATETAVLPILDKANRLLAELGERNKVAERLVGHTTRELLTHECCKAIAGEADKRLFDIVYSRLFAVMQRANRPGTRRAEGQRARARRRRSVEQALSRPNLSPAPPQLRPQGQDEPESTEVSRSLSIDQSIAAVEAVLREDKHSLTHILAIGLPADAAQDLETAVDVHKLVVFRLPMHAESIDVIRRYGFGMIMIHPETRSDESIVPGISEAILSSDMNRDALLVVAGTDIEMSRQFAGPIRESGLQPIVRPVPRWGRIRWADELAELLVEEFQSRNRRTHRHADSND